MPRLLGNEVIPPVLRPGAPRLGFTTRGQGQAPNPVSLGYQPTGSPAAPPWRPREGRPDGLAPPRGNTETRQKRLRFWPRRSRGAEGTLGPRASCTVFAGRRFTPAPCKAVARCGVIRRHRGHAVPLWGGPALPRAWSQSLMGTARPRGGTQLGSRRAPGTRITGWTRPRAGLRVPPADEV